jgi:hypothetical protein
MKAKEMTQKDVKYLRKIYPECIIYLKSDFYYPPKEYLKSLKIRLEKSLTTDNCIDAHLNVNIGEWRQVWHEIGIDGNIDFNSSKNTGRE